MTMSRLLAKYWWVCAILGLMGNIWVAMALTTRRTSSSLRVVQVEQFCPGGPRSYRCVGPTDSLAIVIKGFQRFELGEIIEVHYFTR